MLGYSSAEYGSSFEGFGEVVRLPRLGVNLVRREIADTKFGDLAACYPLLICDAPARLSDALTEFGERDVAFTAVVDPFSAFRISDWQKKFDLFRPYKDHYLVKLNSDPFSRVSSDHRTKARKALKKVDVEIMSAGEANPQEWYELYSELIQRHGLAGVQAFSKDSLEAQLQTPGALYARATSEGTIAGAQIVFQHGDVAFSHLLAFNELGYLLRASYATHWALIEHLAASGALWMNLGGAAGTYSDGNCGLAQFKRGWSQHSLKSYLCGKVLNVDAYSQLCEGRSATDYFPAYRSPASTAQLAA